MMKKRSDEIKRTSDGFIIIIIHHSSFIITHGIFPLSKNQKIYYYINL
jgi:hypothetical protein